MEIKNFCVAELKTVTDADEPGTFEALVSVFGNVDRGGDRVKKGAFKRTLEERGLPPIIWSHNWDIPPIGVVTQAVENNEGLRLKGRLFVGEGEDHPIARQVYAAMTAKDGNGQAPLREFSFGYEVRESSEEKSDGETVRVLEDLELFEAGPTLVGMNPDTRLIAVKQAATAIKEAVEATQPSPEASQADDKPDPNDEPLSEEDRAKIAQALSDPTLNPR